MFNLSLSLYIYIYIYIHIYTYMYSYIHAMICYVIGQFKSACTSEGMVLGLEPASVGTWDLSMYVYIYIYIYMHV